MTSNAPFILLLFCTKAQINLHFCETVHTTQHKKGVCKDALQSGYLHKWRFSSLLWAMWTHKNEYFYLDFLQKRTSVNVWQISTKTYKFLSGAVWIQPKLGRCRRNHSSGPLLLWHEKLKAKGTFFKKYRNNGAFGLLLNSNELNMNLLSNLGCLWGIFILVPRALILSSLGQGNHSFPV